MASFFMLSNWFSHLVTEHYFLVIFDGLGELWALVFEIKKLEVRKQEKSSGAI